MNDSSSSACWLCDQRLAIRCDDVPELNGLGCQSSGNSVFCVRGCACFFARLATGSGSAIASVSRVKITLVYSLIGSLSIWVHLLRGRGALNAGVEVHLLRGALAAGVHQMRGSIRYVRERCILSSTVKNPPSRSHFKQRCTARSHTPVFSTIRATEGQHMPLSSAWSQRQIRINFSVYGISKSQAALTKE